MSMISNEKSQKPALGRGLAALIPQAAGVPVSGELTDRSILRLPIDAIHQDSNQPRKVFKEEAIRELADSIRVQGLIQPVLVRRDVEGYRLIAGERRWRAAQLAGLPEVPAIVRDVSDSQAFEMALVENLQRADLNPIEEAEGYRRLIADYAFTQEQVSQRVGKDRSSVANSLRLLTLPEEIKSMLADEALSMGHARALLGLGDQDQMIQLGHKIVAQNLSVRETEQLVKKKKSPTPEPSSEKKAAVNPHARQVEEELQRVLGTRVRLLDRSGKGVLEIHFFSYEDLNREDDVVARSGELNALLGKGSEFEGKLTFEGQVRVEGKFSGQIMTKDTLIIGEGARVSAEIIAGTVIVNGWLEGNIKASQLIELHQPGRIKGNLETPALAIDKGVVFEGSCKMENITKGAAAVPAELPRK